MITVGLAVAIASSYSCSVHFVRANANTAVHTCWLPKSIRSVLNSSFVRRARSPCGDLLRTQCQHIKMLTLAEPLQQQLFAILKAHRVTVFVLLGTQLRKGHFFIGSHAELLLQLFRYF